MKGGLHVRRVNLGQTCSKLHTCVHQTMVYAAAAPVLLLLLLSMPPSTAIQRNLVLRFKDDTIDDSIQLAQLLQTRCRYLYC